MNLRCTSKQIRPFFIYENVDLQIRQKCKILITGNLFLLFLFGLDFLYPLSISGQTTPIGLAQVGILDVHLQNPNGIIIAFQSRVENP
jgi:hypothetical protein